MIPPAILNLSRRAGLKIKADAKQLTLKHVVLLKDKSIWGIVLFLLGGISLIVIPFTHASDRTSKIIGIVIGSFFVLVSTLTLIRELADRLIIKNMHILFRYNLKPSSFLLDSSMIVRMKTDMRKIRRTGTLGSDFIIITLYLKAPEDEIPIFSYQMEYAKQKDAKALGNEIVRLLNERIQAVAVN